ncbi:metal-dependent hydrolase [Halobacterium noricense]|uniref:metal-dependent hydrolase n=1 Tax=Halobacterium noricense TaxID=223182 RepID=UPI001E4332A4|nr:metal-dependent hydrolase [Halobacterium noricense]UHH25830.1 metal-dependent hydrolase [Halobacterium noricense]
MNKGDHILNGILLAIGLGYVLYPSGGVETLRTIAAVLIPVVLGALFPDVDTDFGKHRKTLHNIPVLALLYVFPMYFGNLQYVWIGVATHYVLDVVGSKRGIALFYPLSDQEYGLPVGVTTVSKYASTVTVVITLVELAAIAVVVHVAPQYVPTDAVSGLL